MRKSMLSLLLLITGQVMAHPVIYQGGWALSSNNMPSYSNNYLWYSFTNRFSAGVEQWRFSRGQEHAESGLVKLNHLLWRDNGPDYQANIYIHGGAGVMGQGLGNLATRGIYQAGVEADWETRSLYTSFKHYQFHAPRGVDLSVTSARVGFSPVIADMGNLQTWFMLQAMHIREVEEKVLITPMLRFFYHNVLWEFGSSTRGDWMLNLMVHY
jgi:hypothetical protein